MSISLSVGQKIEMTRYRRTPFKLDGEGIPLQLRYKHKIRIIQLIRAIPALDLGNAVKQPSHRIKIQIIRLPRLEENHSAGRPGFPRNYPAEAGRDFGAEFECRQSAERAGKASGGNQQRTGC